jgi:transposase
MTKKHATAKSARRGGLETSVQVTETCEKESPHLITHVTTTAATTTDEAMTETIHAELEQTDLTPRQHLLDSGSITAPILVSSQQKSGIEVIGPAHVDVKWQANTEQGIDVSQFRLDWDQQQATCPQGHTSMSWTPAIDYRKNEVIQIKFSRHRLRRMSSADPLYPL